MRHWPLSDIVPASIGAAALFTFLWHEGGWWSSRVVGPLMSWRKALIAGVLTAVAFGFLAWFAHPAPLR